MQQQKTPSSKPAPIAPVPAPIRLTPEQLSKVSGAGGQQCRLPYKSW